MSADEMQAFWIVGYGNRQRRDDGVGPYVVERLKGALQHQKGVHLLELSQLRADMAADLRKAERLVFVDATIDNPGGGRKWCRLYPDLGKVPFLTHHVDPAFLLGLMAKLYSYAAPAWSVSIHGSDFGFGVGLSPEAAQIADRVSLEICEFICKKH